MTFDLNTEKDLDVLNLTAHRGKYNDEEQRILIEKVIYSYNYGDVYTVINGIFVLFSLCDM